MSRKELLRKGRLIMQPSYIFLAITVAVALFARNKPFIYVGLLVTCATAFFEHIININSLLTLSIFALLSFCYFKLEHIHKYFKIPLFIFLVVFTAGFVLHLIPGFSNAIAFNKILISKASYPYSMYLNFDKVMAGLVLYTFSSLSDTEKNMDFKAIWHTILLLSLCIIIVVTSSVATGYVKLDPKLPDILLLWSINNFFFVCFSEEVIFRGFLQNYMRHYHTQ